MMKLIQKIELPDLSYEELYELKKKGSQTQELQSLQASEPNDVSKTRRQN